MRQISLRSAWLLLAVGTGLLNPAGLVGQGTREDYQRAAELPRRFRDQVFGDAEDLRWNEDESLAWYRVRTGPLTHEFKALELPDGRSRPAFDHSAIADALSEAIGPENAFSADQLPIDELRAVTGGQGGWTFRTGQRMWRWDEREGRLFADEAPPVLDRQLTDRGGRFASRGGRRETSIRFENRSGQSVELFWIDSDGELQSYGRLEPDQTRDQHTYSGHVWCVNNDAGDWGVFQAEATPAVALIEGPARPPAERTAVERQRSAKSPDGRWQAKLIDGCLKIEATEGEQVFELATVSQPGNELSDPIYWSPDSQKLAVVEITPGQRRELLLLESTPRNDLQPRLRRQRYDKPGDRIDRPRVRLFDVAAREELPVDDQRMPEPFDIGQFHWWPDSSGLVFLYNERGHQRLRLLEVDVASGQTQVLIEETSPTFIDYAHKNIIRFLDATREVLWSSERSGWHHLYRWRRSDGTLQPVTRGEWVVVDVERIDEPSGSIWFSASGRDPEVDPYYRQLYRGTLDGGPLQALTAGDGDHQWQWSPQRRWLVDRWSRIDQASQSVLRDGATGAEICLLGRADDGALRAAGWRAPERFVAPGRDGKTPIYGLIVRPSVMEPGRRYPVIEKIYAGPQGFHVPKSFDVLEDVHALAELGFIVVQIDGMGTSGRSKAFHDVCWRNLADAGFPDRITWLKAAAVHEPAIDLSRVGIYGGSAGGQSAVRALLAHGDLYDVAVADCGCHDNRLDKIWWNELWMGWPVGPHYEEQASSTQAHRLEGKLLLIVGELDDNVDPASTMQVVDALIRADKDFDLLIIPGAGHGAAESPYGRRRRMDFFVRHLLGVEPRSPAPSP